MDASWLEAPLQGAPFFSSRQLPGGQRGSGLNLCPVAAVATSWHLKQQKRVLRQCWELESEIKVWQGPVPSEAGSDPSLTLLASGGQCLLLLG